MLSPGCQLVSLSQVLQVQNRSRLKNGQFKKFLAKHLTYSLQYRSLSTANNNNNYRNNMMFYSF